MSYFKDLTVHTYTKSSPELDVVNIGWLGHPLFRRGFTSKVFRDELERLCRRRIILHLGFHRCPFCPSGWFGDYRRWQRLGNGQIRVLGQKGRWYVAPTMIHHYVTRHFYRPPTEFIKAVLAPQGLATGFLDYAPAYGQRELVFSLPQHHEVHHLIDKIEYGCEAFAESGRARQFMLKVMAQIPVLLPAVAREALKQVTLQSADAVTASDLKRARRACWEWLGDRPANFLESSVCATRAAICLLEPVSPKPIETLQLFTTFVLGTGMHPQSLIQLLREHYDWRQP